MRLLRPNTTYRVDGSRQVEVSQSAAAVLQKALEAVPNCMFFCRQVERSSLWLVECAKLLQRFWPEISFFLASLRWTKQS